MRTNETKHRLTSGGVALGTMVFVFNVPGITRIAEAAGAEFILFDLEHVGWELGDLHPVLAAGRGFRPTPLVRVPTLQRHLISRALDLGALGVMVPMVEDADQARTIVRAAKYPPQGDRGYGILYADDEAEGGVAPTVVRGNEETLVIVQIETAAGIENVDEIAHVPGVDVLWIGPYDLTISLGIPGKFEDPAYTSAVDRLVTSCQAAGRAAGILVGSAAEAIGAIEQGFRCLAYGTDVDLLIAGLSQGFADIRASIPNAP